jgi:hypothetical protein
MKSNIAMGMLRQLLKPIALDKLNSLIYSDK